MISWTIANDNVLTVIDDNHQRHTTTKQNPKWNDILAAIRAERGDEVVRLMSMKESFVDFMEGSVMVKGDEVFFGNRALHGLDIQRILSFARQNLPVRPMLRFLNNKMRNPSWRSIEELYQFIEQKGMPVTDRGTIVGYKGVRADFYSKTGNVQTVVLQGKVDSGGHILNEIGATIEVARSSVCDDFNESCGPGLHVGSYQYATSWAGPDGKVLEVEFSPEDAVSVPPYEKTDKLRVCKYKVNAECQGLLDDTYYAEKQTPTEEDQNETFPEEEVEQEQVDEYKANQSAYNDGYAQGTADGKAHKRRLYNRGCEGDEDGTYVDNNLYITGYNDGYQVERRHQRNQGSDCLQSKTAAQVNDGLDDMD